MSMTNGLVRGFGQYTAEQLLITKRDLELKMSPEQLAACSLHYRQAERRDPRICELKLLDQLASNTSHQPQSQTVDSFCDLDKSRANTFADLYSKHRALDPDGMHPFTLGAAFATANDYLTRSGRVRALSNTHILLTGEEHSLLILPQKSHQQHPVRERDHIVLFLPKVPDAMTQKQLLQTVCKAVPFKKVFPVRRDGLLATLLRELSNGAHIELSNITPVGTEPTTEPLTAQFYGRYCAIVAEENASLVLEHSEKNGLYALFFARVSQRDRFEITLQNLPLFSINGSFLRTLTVSTTVKAELSEEKPSSTAAISRLPITVLTDQELLCTAAYSRSRKNGFYQAIDTAVCAIATLAASGISYTDQHLAVGLTSPHCVPQDSKSIGNVLSAILGLYRVQAELGISMAGAEFDVSPNTDKQKITVYALAGGTKALPSTFTKEGTSISLLAPARRADGVIDFVSLRKLLKEITALAKDGTLLSARVLCHETADTGLTKMEQCELHCRANGLTDETYSIAFLLESESPLPEALPIGVVEKK